MSLSDISHIQSLSNSFALMNRRHYIANSPVHENNADHSFTVALLCIHYYHKLPAAHLSEAKVIGYALAHDLVEVYAGDAQTHATPEELKQKDIDEQKALEQLQIELAFDQNLVELLTTYQDHADDESRFVWACDKIQAYIQGELDNWRPYREYAISKRTFIDKINEQIAKSPEVIRPEFQKLADHWVAVYPETWEGEK